MNILEIQNRLKNFSQEQLVQEMQRPSGQAPQFLVLGEMQRRKQMQADFAKQQSEQNQTTVAQDAVAAAGVPQGGIAQMSRSMAPKTDTTQNTGIASVAPQGMKSGGAVRKMQSGGSPNSYLAAKTDPAVIAYANKLGMTVDEYLAMLGQQGATTVDTQASARAQRDKMKSLEPLGDGSTFPTQSDLNKRYMDQKYLVDTNPMQPAAGITAVAPLRVPKPEAMPAMPSAAPGMAAPNLGASGIRQGISPLPAGQIPYNPNVPGAVPPSAPAVASPADVPAGSMPAAEQSWGDWLSGMVPESMKQFGLNAGAAMGESLRGGAGAPPTGPAGAPMPQTQPAVPPQGAVAPNAPMANPASPSGGGMGAPGGGGVGGGAGVPSAGTPSDYESELMAMLQGNERKAEQDKWLALAQFGLQLMGANSSSLAGSIGQAGQNVIPAYQQSRDANEADRLKLMGALEESRMARQAMAMRAAGAGRSAGPKPMPATIIAGLQRQLSDAQTAMASLPPPTAGEQDPYASQRMMLQTQIAQLQAQIGMGMSQYGVAPLGSPTAFDFDATQPG